MKYAFHEGMLYDGKEVFVMPVDFSNDEHLIFSLDGQKGVNIRIFYENFGLKMPKFELGSSVLEHIYSLIMNIDFYFNPVKVCVEQTTKLSLSTGFNQSMMSSSIDEMFKQGKFDGTPITEVDPEVLDFVMKRKPKYMNKLKTNMKPYIQDINKGSTFLVEDINIEECVATLNVLRVMSKQACVDALCTKYNVDQVTACWLLVYVYDHL